MVCFLDTFVEVSPSHETDSESTDKVTVKEMSVTINEWLTAIGRHQDFLPRIGFQFLVRVSMSLSMSMFLKYSYVTRMLVLYRIIYFSSFSTLWTSFQFIFPRGKTIFLSIRLLSNQKKMVKNLSSYQRIKMIGTRICIPYALLDTFLRYNTFKEYCNHSRFLEFFDMSEPLQQNTFDTYTISKYFFPLCDRFIGKESCS